MADATLAPPERTPGARPWTQSLAAWLPLAPVWVGLGVAVANLALGVAWFSLLGWPPSFTPQQILGPASTMSLLIGFSIAATAYSQRASLQALRALRPALRASDEEFVELVGQVVRFDAKRLRLVGAIFVLGGVPLVLTQVSREVSAAGASLVASHVLWLVWLNAGLCWMLSRTLAYEVEVSRAFSRLGADRIEVKLLDLDPLSPFVRRGLQSALIWILAVSILAVQFSVGWGANFLPILLLSMVVVAGAILVLPVLGIHQRRVDAKAELLARLAAEIQPAQEILLGARIDAAPEVAARLHALLALRQQIETARDWPFDVSSLIRLALYLAIGLGSWLGAALVERALDVWL
jgi:hypothetical protein